MESLSQYNHYLSQFKAKKCCVIIPTYNNATTLGGVIADVLEYCSDVIVVNDGSTDNTLEVLKDYPQIDLVTYPKNRGKGHALRTAFKHAHSKGFQYGVTIDSDGQHYAKDLPTFLNLIESHPNAIVIGTRDLNQENMDGKSNFANRFSNFWFKVETGLDMPDTQSGYRLYPLHSLHNIRFFTRKYEFEIEVIVRAAWRDVEVIPAAIDVFYPEKEERVSHFRPFKDFFRISVLNTILVLLAFLVHHPRRVFNEYRKKTFRQIFREVKNSATLLPNHIIALSIGFGVFMGIFPIWGYQLLVGFIIAHFLSLHKGIFFIAANISLPPMIPFILYLSYVLGGFLLGDGSWSVDFELSLASVKNNLWQYIIGAIALSTMAGSLFGAVSYLVLTLLKRR